MPSIDNIHQDHPTDQVQAVFGGINAQDPPHLLGPDEVQTATNIDFQLWPGAARARRGWGTYITTTFTHSNAFLRKHEGTSVAFPSAFLRKRNDFSTAEGTSVRCH